jgi:hypothetical protein
MKLNRRDARVLQEIFEHPFPHNLEWADVVSLIGHHGSALERHDGKYEFQIGSQQAVFAKPRHKDVGVEDITELRRFLKQSGLDPTSMSVEEAVASEAHPTVVLVDHHRARFFEAEPGSAHFEEREHLEPTDLHGFERHLEHRKEADYKGQRVPEATEFYERIAQQLKDASTIVLIGDATGKSSAMSYLVDYLKDKHKEIAGRISGTVAHADVSDMTVPEIERLATTR